MIINVASLQYGVIFKKAFGQIDVFKGFVKDFLGIDLEIERVETEKEFDGQVGPVKAKFDLYAEDVKNRIIVEIQHNRLDDHYDRFYYYHNLGIIEQVKSYADYRIRKKVYTIVVLTGGDKEYKEPWLQSDSSLYTLEGKRYPMLDHKLIFLCPKYVNEKIPEPYHEWLLGIKDTLDNQVDESLYTNPTLRHIFELIEEDGLTSAERALLKDEYSQQSLIKQERAEGLAEGIGIGIDKGIEIGIDKGIEIGIDKGIEIGIDKGITNTKRELLLLILEQRLGRISPNLQPIWNELTLPQLELLQTLAWEVTNWEAVNQLIGASQP